MKYKEKPQIEVIKWNGNVYIAQTPENTHFHLNKKTLKKYFAKCKEK